MLTVCSEPQCTTLVFGVGTCVEHDVRPGRSNPAAASAAHGEDEPRLTQTSVAPPTREDRRTAFANVPVSSRSSHRDSAAQEPQLLAE
jgi:hypothetical protein